MVFFLFFVFIPITGLDRPWGFQEVEAPRFQDNRHMKVVRLSALSTGRLYHPGDIPGTHFCNRMSLPQGHGDAGRIMSMKNSHDTIGNRTRDLNQLRHHTPLRWSYAGAYLYSTSRWEHSGSSSIDRQSNRETALNSHSVAQFPWP